MSLVPLYGALGVFLVALGALVFAARPGHAVNRVFGAVLVLEGTADVFFQMMREAPTPLLYFHYINLAHWYFIPEMVLLGVLVHLLFPPEPRHGRLRAAALGAYLAVGLATLALFAYDHTLAYPVQVRTFDGALSADLGAGSPLLAVKLAFDGAHNLVHLAAIALAGRWAVSTSRTAVERRSAAVVGLAFLALLGRQAVQSLVNQVLHPGLILEMSAMDALVGVVLIASIPLLLLSLARAASAFEGPMRRAALAVGGVPMVLGLWPGWEELFVGLGLGNGRVVLVALFAGLVALALVRFGLAGFGEPMRRRVGQLSHAGIAVAVVALPSGLAFALAGGSLLWLTAAAVLGLAAVAVSPAPLRGVASRMAEAVLLRPDDPAVAGERAKLYTAALERCVLHDGKLRPEDETILRGLRRELDLSERAHVLLLSTVRRRREREGSPPEQLLGRYALRREVGRGAFGTVYLATDTATGREVVVKRFHVGSTERRALREARALGAVRHPRVVPLLDVQRVGDEVFLVLAYQEGGSLAQLMEREGPLSAARASQVAADVLEGLAALHAAGLVHRDVKPGNILLDGEGRAVLGDFGAARFTLTAAETSMSVDREVGSYATAPPEALRYEPATPRSDLYAAGAVLYRALTGEHYVDLLSPDPAEVRKAILTQPPRLPHPRVPSRMAGVLATALAKEPEARFATAGDMLDALRDAAPAPRAPAAA